MGLPNRPGNVVVLTAGRCFHESCRKSRGFMLLYLKQLIEYLARGVEFCAALIIAIAALEATIGAFILFLKPRAPPQQKNEVRLTLGRWLAVALKFELRPSRYSQHGSDSHMERNRKAGSDCYPEDRTQLLPSAGYRSGVEGRADWRCTHTSACKRRRCWKGLSYD